ncbi:MAG: hypothetical protein JJU45_16525 [Acidimicrobiia bacterium]|nr:hypothetical protein [Acidimicrobiia bacterium]
MTTGSVEVHTRNGWQRLTPGLAPPVSESDLFHLRGLPAGAEVVIGNERRTADTAGSATIALRDCPELRGHLGLVEITVAGTCVGEIDVRPDKLSEEAWRTLRADLERTWAGLVLDPAAVSRLQAGLPPPHELWRRIEQPVHSIISAPRTTILPGSTVRHQRQVRHPRELTVSVQRAALRGSAGLARVPQRSCSTPENVMVADTLRRLRTYAMRTPGGDPVAYQIGRLLGHSILSDISAHQVTTDVTWGMRTDARYRQVHAVARLLRRPDLEPTEGPGELRLGVEGTIRLYEYWVYLRVLLACAARYGAPPSGFSELATPLVGRRHRLDLPAGTTVTFPGPVHVAFEPSIDTSGRGWQGIEYVPHPDPDQVQLLATPDVVVYRPHPVPWVTIIDAKYVGRHWVDHAAAATHAKYARMRKDGDPVVRHVMVAHPHEGKDARWAGYGSVGMIPGRLQADLPLPPPATNRQPPPRSVPETTSGTSPAQSPATPVRPPSPASDQAVVIADQNWMRHHLGTRRLNLTDLQTAAVGDDQPNRCIMVMPLVPGLLTFQLAAQGCGWETVGPDSGGRAELVAALADTARTVPAETKLVLVSGWTDAVAACKAVRADVIQFDAIDSLAAGPIRSNRPIRQATQHALDPSEERRTAEATIRQLLAGSGRPLLLTQLAEAVRQTVGDAGDRSKWFGHHTFGAFVRSIDEGRFDFEGHSAWDTRVNASP